MKFLLMILLAGPSGAQPVHFEPFIERAACEAKLRAVLKQIPSDPEINFVAVCAPVKNAASVDV